MSTREQSTAGLSGTRPAVASGVAPAQLSLPTLTLLYHPDLRRVGERAVLAELARGQRVQLGRLQPELSAEGAAVGRPLSDRFLSREPILLVPGDEGAVILDPAACRSQLRIDGQALAGPCRIEGPRLERGVVLDLAGRIVLLLHLHSPARAERSRRESFGMVGSSAGMQRVGQDIRNVGDLTFPVLIRGETGTGKELVARALHTVSRHHRGPFVAINLGAVPADLAAAELFGAVRGAYTGAGPGREGLFQKAGGGTLFLDEVGEAPTELQVSLLRALETGEVRPVGADRAVPVRTRVLAATDADLEALAEEGGFRSPLLHRLASYEIRLPPLRQRRDDLGPLFLAFLRQELAAVGEDSRLQHEDATDWLPPSLMVLLAVYGWPGNVRELRNVVRQLVVASRGQPVLQADERLLRLLSASSSPAELSLAQPAPEGEETGTAQVPAPGRRKPSEVGEEELREALREARWDLAAAARDLGLSRSSLYLRISELPNLRTAGDLSPEEIRRSHAEHDGDLEAMVQHLEVSERALRRRLRELGLI